MLGQLGSGQGLVATVRRWTVSLLTFTVVLAVISVLLRQQIADPVGVKHDPWAAALGLPAAGLWLELSVLRGVLQGIGDYKGVGVSLVGEQAARLVTGALLAAAGARRDRRLLGHAAVVHRDVPVLRLAAARLTSRPRPACRCNPAPQLPRLR